MNTSRRSSISGRSQSVTLLDEIDQWERGTLLLVKQTADRARQRITDLMMSSQDTHDYQRQRSNTDHSIHDLNLRLRDLNRTLNTYTPHIKLHITPIDWSTILRVFMESSSSSLDD